MYTYEYFKLALLYMYMLIFTNKMALGLHFEKLATKHHYKD